MRSLFITFVSLVMIQGTSAQSPYLKLHISLEKEMDRNCKLEVMFCRLNKPTPTKSVFGRDTSKVDFTKLSITDFNCGEYFETDNANKPYNEFEYGNQKYVYELIILVRISDVSSRGWNYPMYVVFPVKYQSFTSTIELTDIRYESEKMIYVDNVPDTREEHRLVIRQSLKDFPLFDFKKSPIKLAL